MLWDGRIRFAANLNSPQTHESHHSTADLLDAGANPARLHVWTQLLAALGTNDNAAHSTSAFAKLLLQSVDTSRFFPPDCHVLAVGAVHGRLVPAMFVQMHGSPDGSWEETAVEVRYYEADAGGESGLADGRMAKLPANHVVREAQGYVPAELLHVAAIAGYSQLATLLVDVSRACRSIHPAGGVPHLGAICAKLIGTAYDAGAARVFERGGFRRQYAVASGGEARAPRCVSSPAAAGRVDTADVL